ncbi:MAG: hypothetical protein QM731_03440 [Chitinophagaceae bacterium]
MKNRVFYDWVSPKLDLFLLLVINICLAFTSGISSSLQSYMAGSQSSIPADVTMASYAYLAGMACVFPFIVRLRQLVNTRMILVTVFLSLILINFILSQTDQPLIMVMGSFAEGCVKLVGSIEIISALFPILMPNGERYQVYAVYYPVSLIFSPVSAMCTVWFANLVNWQFGFHFSNLLLFIGLLIVLILVHPRFPGRKVPFRQFDWLGLILLAASMLLGEFVLVYGQTEDWWKSAHIQAAAIFGILAFVLFLQRTLRLKRPVASFELFTNRYVYVGLSLLFILCMFYSTTAPQNVLQNIMLKNDPVKTTEISLYAIPGYILGSLFCLFYYRKFSNFKVVIAIACGCYILSAAMMYFLVSNATGAQDLFVPMVFRGMGIIISYISVGIYVAGNAPAKFMQSVPFFLIAIRSFVGPLMWGSLFTNWLYTGQIRNIDRIAVDMDMLNPAVTARYEPLVKAAAAKGMSISQAANNATQQIFKPVQSQASLLAVREIYGVVVVAGLILLVAILFFSFETGSRKGMLKWRNPFRIKELAQAVPV